MVRTIGLSLFLLLATAGSGSASDALPLGLTARARQAQRVVVARAQSVTPRWVRNAFGDELIVSEVVLEVEESLKGDAPLMIFMDLEGGTMGGITLRVSGLPTLEPGERAVFLLDEIRSGTHVPHGRGDGILKLDRDRVRGTPLRLADVRSLVRAAER